MGAGRRARILSVQAASYIREAAENMQAEVCLQAAVYLRAETYTQAAVYLQGETYTQEEPSTWEAVFLVGKG